METKEKTQIKCSAYGNILHTRDDKAFRFYHVVFTYLLSVKKGRTSSQRRCLCHRNISGVYVCVCVFVVVFVTVGKYITNNTGGCVIRWQYDHDVADDARRLAKLELVCAELPLVSKPAPSRGRD